MSNICNIREIEKLSTETIREYQKFYEKSHSMISNSCFTNRICWNVFFNYYYRILNNEFCLVADTSQYIDTHIVFPLGDICYEELALTIDYWNKKFTILGKTFRVEFVEEHYCPILSRVFNEMGLIFDIIEQVDCEDYLYNVDDYLKLSGRENRKKNRLIRQLYFQRRTYCLEHLNDENVSDCIYLLEMWRKNKYLLDNDADILPIRYFLEHYKQLNSICIILRSNGNVIAFLVASITNGNTCTFHFSKADPNRAEAYFILHYIFIDEILKPDYNIEFLNFEDDMGIGSIRYYKSHIGEFKKMKKYSFIVRQEEV